MIHLLGYFSRPSLPSNVCIGRHWRSALPLIGCMQTRQQSTLQSKMLNCPAQATPPCEAIRGELPKPGTLCPTQGEPGAGVHAYTPAAWHQACPTQATHGRWLTTHGEVAPLQAAQNDRVS